MLMVLSTIQSPAVALVYVVIFGIGSTGGMMIMSALIGLPAKLTAQRYRRAHVLLRGAAAVTSMVLGAFIAYQTYAMGWPGR